MREAIQKYQSPDVSPSLLMAALYSGSKCEASAMNAACKMLTLACFGSSEDWQKIRDKMLAMCRKGSS